MERLFDTILSSLHKKLTSAQYSHSVCVLGDFNFPSADWNLMHSHRNRGQQFPNIFSVCGLSPLILNESTHCAGNNLDNILCDLHAVPLSFEIMGTNDIRDRYPIFLNLENAVQPNFSRMVVLYFPSCEEMEVFKKSWTHFTYESYPSRANVVDFYNYLRYSIEISFSKKRKKRLANPFYYTSNTKHTLNKTNTARRKTVEIQVKLTLNLSKNSKCSLVRNWTECYSLLELRQTLCWLFQSYKQPQDKYKSYGDELP